MVTPTPRPARAASALFAVALGLAALPGPAAGQGMISADPYKPYSYQYNNYVVPTMPTNLALPGAARQAAEFNAEANGSGMSRYNTFGRWMDDYESELSARRGGGAASADARRYVPNREADRRFAEQEEKRTQSFFDRESERARIATERDRYHAAAGRETDPARRAAYLGFVRRLSDPKEAPAALREIDALYEARRAGATARADATKTPKATATGPAPNTGTGASPTAAPGRTTAPAGTNPATAPRPTPGVVLPDQRPPMPTEIRTRDRAPARTERAPSPPQGGSTLPAPTPDPTPDDVAAPR